MIGDFMNGWTYNLDKLPDLAIISGPNASGKTTLPDRVAEASTDMCILQRINASRLMPDNGEGKTGEIIGSIGGTNRSLPIILVDEAGPISENEMAKVYARLKDAYTRRRHVGKVAKAHITRLGDKFEIREIK